MVRAPSPHAPKSLRSIRCAALSPRERKAATGAMCPLRRHHRACPGDPRIRRFEKEQDVDGRNKSGHDEEDAHGSFARSTPSRCGRKAVKPSPSISAVSAALKPSSASENIGAARQRMGIDGASSDRIKEVVCVLPIQPKVSKLLRSP